MQTCYYYIDANEPDNRMLEEAAAIVRAGGLAAFPTETVYGLGASAFNREAVLRLYAVKRRPLTQPFLLHISQLEQLEGIVELEPDAMLLTRLFWPGPLSLLVSGGRGVAPEMLGGKGSIGLRFPSHPVARAFIDATGPLAATSANLHGELSPESFRQAVRELDGLIEAVVAVETGIAGVDSTIIDMSVRPYVIVREGELDRADIEAALPGKVSINVRKG